MAKLSVAVNETDHILGPDDAPVTLLEYGDYECPYCGEAYPIVQKIIKKMGANLRFVFRNFPLTESHPHAPHAAQAAESAALQNEFWEMHDIVYENQDALEDADLRRYATTLGLDVKKWARDFSSDAVESKVQQDFMGGVRSGVNGTPTFFINGVRHDDSFEYPVLLAALQEQLTAAKPKPRQTQATKPKSTRGK